MRFLVACGLISTIGTLLSLSKNPSWMVRIWDFPRLQLAVLSALAGGVYASRYSRGGPADRAFLASCFGTSGWQMLKIRPFTRLSSVQVKGPERSGAPRLRLMISNVQMENRQHHRLLEAIRENDPDVVLLLETDTVWARSLDSLKERYPYSVRQLQSNYYGMMLVSRFPLVEPRIEFRVQEDIPSVDTGIELPDGTQVFLHGLHPRPPEPLRNQISAPRDAELVLVGRKVRAEGDRPRIVAGDLNDVAWSATTELFLRLSGLLDPRVGRGLYSSFPTHVPFLRCPVDHVFHSRDFRLVDLRRLPSIGSDHFPMLITLSYEPERKTDQEPATPHADDREDAGEKLATQREAARSGDDRPS